MPIDNYIAYYMHRPFSGIRLLSDAAFAIGMDRLRAEVAGRSSVTRVINRHLLVACRRV